MVLATSNIKKTQKSYRNENKLALATKKSKKQWIIIIIIKNECHSNIIVDRLQGCRMNECKATVSVHTSVHTTVAHSTT